MVPEPPPPPKQSWQQQLALAKIWTAGMKSMAKKNQQQSPKEKK